MRSPPRRQTLQGRTRVRPGPLPGLQPPWAAHWPPWALGSSGRIGHHAAIGRSMQCRRFDFLLMVPLLAEGRIMRYFARWAVLLCALLAGAQIAAAAAGKRVALVIGNGSYAHIAHLPNVANDAAAMAALFKGAGFDRVEVRLNAGAAELRRALREFAGLAATPTWRWCSMPVTASRSATNYLIPVDARLIRTRR